MQYHSEARKTLNWLQDVKSTLFIISPNDSLKQSLQADQVTWSITTLTIHTKMHKFESQYVKIYLTNDQISTTAESK